MDSVEERPCEAGITKSRLKSEAEVQRLRPSLWGRNRAPMAEDLSPRLSACEEGCPLSGIQSNRDRSESYCITIGFDHKHETDFSSKNLAKNPFSTDFASFTKEKRKKSTILLYNCFS